MDHTITNQQKYENYKYMMGQFKKALKSGFYLEANSIIYAVLEDRTNSLLVYMNRKVGEKEVIGKKLRRIANKLRSGEKIPKSKLTIEFIDRIIAWKNNRNTIIHSFAKIEQDRELLNSIALEGYDIARHLSNIVGVYKRDYLKNKFIIEQSIYEVEK